MPIRLTQEQVIEKFKTIHRDKYDYSKVEYKSKDIKVCIICPEHGEFWQTPNNHWKGKGCYECSRKKMGNKKYNTETFIEKASELHNGKYDYSGIVYKSIIDKVPIKCPDHGVFYQLPYLHLCGSGCPSCAKIKQGFEHRLTNEEFIEKARKIHGDKYDYSLSNYSTSKHRVTIICPTHGKFQQTPDKHLSGCGCPKCIAPYSKNEMEIYDIIASLMPNVPIEQHDRNILGGKEVDIYIPSLKVGIEYNGLYWHNSKIINKNYHLDKLNLCKERGIKLIQIFEDEYVNNKPIVLNKLRHLIKCDNALPKIMGRKCEIREIDLYTAEPFLNKNHIQGFVGSSIYVGAYYNDVPVGVMTFKKENKAGYWELNRCATDNDYICSGVAGKMFKYFVRKYNPISIKSFADRRWTINENNNLYTNLGFTLNSYTKPEYRYYRPQDGCIRQHKFGFRKDKLHKKYDLPLTMTESEMTEQLGYTKIWDCGLIKYVWENKKVED